MMKKFTKRELREALAYAAAGGQALHLHNVISNWSRAPRCFRDAIRRKELIAHLFDQDTKRLVAMAYEFGIMRIYVHRRGQPGQHIDLCGVNLIKAETLCDDPEEYRIRFGRHQET